MSTKSNRVATSEVDSNGLTSEQEESHSLPILQMSKSEIRNAFFGMTG